MKGTIPTPFLEVKLSSSPGVRLMDFAWNPSQDFVGLFATCLSDGCVALWEVKDNLKILATLPSVASATCCE